LSRWCALLASPVAVCILAGCLSSRPVPEFAGATGSASQALGSFTIASPVLGQKTLSPTSCSAGDHQFFLGADFSDPASGLVLRLVVDALEGPAVRLYAADAEFDKSVVFRRAECSVFHFSLDSTGWRVNKVYDYRLTLQLDCSRAGDSIVGSLSSTHCH